MQRWENWMREKRIEAIVPVPMYSKKERYRGYNQAALFGRALSEKMDIPCIPRLMIRVKDTRPQKELNGRERENNVKNAFQSSDNVVKYKRILIVDDIYTTGSTVEAAAAEDFRRQFTMEVRNCKMCGRLFNVLNNERICPACQKKLEDKFHEVKQYLEDHPGASVEQTATDNDISTKQIRQWVKEERLILSSATEAGIVCEKCGKPIRTGRFCDKCKERMANEFQNAYQKPEPKMEDLRSTRDRDRMRYLKNE